MKRPPRSLLSVVIAMLAIIMGGIRVSAQEGGAPADPRHVEFPSLGGALKLEGYLFESEDRGSVKHPAVVMMHGCSGLMNPATGKFFGLYRPWARALTRAGFTVLVMDSATPRGLGQTCSGPHAEAMWRERPKDAYAALAYLQQQDTVLSDRVALIGWSQGGGAVLFALNQNTVLRQSPAGTAALARLPHDFRAAVAFYPGACHAAAHARSMPTGADWTSRVPLLVLFGDADVWTLLQPCADFLDAAMSRGNPIDLKVYPGAYHAFDAPGLKRTELLQYKTADGRVPVIETDRAARADAFDRVRAFLKVRVQD